MDSYNKKAPKSVHMKLKTSKGMGIEREKAVKQEDVLSGVVSFSFSNAVVVRDAELDPLFSTSPN